MSTPPAHDSDLLARQFEVHRAHLRSVAYRMLGSTSEADDAVQESWLRLDRSDADGVDNLAGWLTTVVARICLDKLRTRRSRREEPLDMRVPDPIVTRDDSVDPEQQAIRADSVGIALLVVLESLDPAERLAFVLHDTFALPFDEIAPMLGRTPAAARKLASRARQRVRGATHVPEPDLRQQRRVVDAFMSASLHGDFDALVAVLDPDVVLRVDHGVNAGMSSTLVRGAENVAGQALTFSQLAPTARRARINGSLGIVNAPRGKLFAVLALTVVDDRIVELDILADPDRLATIDVAFLGEDDRGSVSCS